MRALPPYHFRGKTRVLGRLVPSSGERRAKVFGAGVDLDSADAIQRLVYLGDFEGHETALVRPRLKPGMTFIDADANCGYYTLLAASLVGPSGAVWAFEPHTPMRERLERPSHRINCHRSGSSGADWARRMGWPRYSRARAAARR
ncbi:MAG TPA: hypothetical protein VGZ22_17990 [Isosphaeraceae bacterium]|jgi:hypothetical protein|nr:hypothetical protein [Isosphaeraceae bacterium]